MGRIIELAWVPARSDYAQAQTVRNRTRNVWRKLSILFVGCAVFCAFVIGRNESWLTRIIVGVVVLAFLAVFMLGALRWAPGKLWSSNPALQAPTTARIDQNGILMTADGAATQWSWDRLDSVAEAEDVFVVQVAGLGTKPFFVIAKRGLRPDTTIDSLREALTTGTSSKASTDR